MISAPDNKYLDLIELQDGGRINKYMKYNKYLAKYKLENKNKYKQKNDLL
jgi:hypothetical protein